MNASIICFTKNGLLLANKIKCLDTDNDFDIFVKSKEIKSDAANAEGVELYEKSVSEWAREQFMRKAAVVFIGAMGIAVRAIADVVKDKLTDPAVIVIDELGRFVIPILSGHVGGGNELAEGIAHSINAMPVITTATDINDAFAVDMFAKEQGLNIVNRDGIARTSSKELNKKTLSISLDKGMLPTDICISNDAKDLFCKGTADKALIYLEPKQYVLGIGCKRDKDFESIKEVVEEALNINEIDAGEIVAIASIDIKKDEKGIISLAELYKVPFNTYSSTELNSVEGDFTESDFVKDITGVGNVCERAALCEAKHGHLLQSKYSKNGVTVAIAAIDWRLKL